jgi:hypothetical protein
MRKGVANYANAAGHLRGIRSLVEKVISISVAVAPSAGSSRTTFQAKFGSGVAT